jgi:hypothetical protein
MASVRRVPRSPFWIAKFRDGDRVVFKSTKQKNKSNALSIALEWERMATLAHKGELTQATVLDFANTLLERFGQASVGKVSTQDFARYWIQKGFTVESTRKRYESVIQSFLASLGPVRSAAPIASVITSEIEAFRASELAQGKTPSTADFGVKVLRAMFESARKKNERLDNPAEGIDPLPVAQQERIPFTDAQILKLLSIANEEWQGMILLGAL